MAVTKTVTHSYGSRVGNAFKGVVGGFIAVVAGICLLWWNEGRTVKRQRTLDQGRKDVVEAKYDEVDSSLESKLVHVSGAATTDEVLEDQEFYFAVKAFQLERKVEMYQWVEHEEHETKEKLGGSEEETITYIKPIRFWTMRTDWHLSLWKTTEPMKPMILWKKNLSIAFHTQEHITLTLLWPPADNSGLS